jgi:peptidoglycan hydrolase-like protein with peptidoglycan-binding domain
MSNSNLTVDGHFGPQTKSALMDFERKNSLNPDGVLDKLALAMLDKSEPDTMAEISELIDLIISIIDPYDKGESRVRAESIFDNLMKTLPFSMRTSARMVWKEKFGVNPTLEVLQWWKQRSD